MSSQTTILDYMSAACKEENKDKNVAKHQRELTEHKESTPMQPKKIECRIFIESPLDNVYGQRVGTIQELVNIAS